jgi:acyl dehydratase
MKLEVARVGEWTAPRRYEVDADAIRAYAASVGYPDPSRFGAGAPPLFGVVPAREPMLEALQAVVPDQIRAATSVHGEHDIVLRRPIEPGATLLTRAAVVGLRVVSAGTQVVTKTETTLEDGEPVDEQFWTMVLRGVDLGWSGGEAPPPKPLPDESARPDTLVGDWIAPDQSLRYAEASGDKDAYVLDEEAAHAAGFPGVILHGLCTMAFAARVVVDHCVDGDGRRLRRLGVRFTRPVLLGQKVVTSIRALPAPAGEALYTFEVADAAGAPVIRRGVAEFRRAV